MPLTGSKNEQNSFEHRMEEFNAQKQRCSSFWARTNSLELGESPFLPLPLPPQLPPGLPDKCIASTEAICIVRFYSSRRWWADTQPSTFWKHSMCPFTTLVPLSPPPPQASREPMGYSRPWQGWPLRCMTCATAPSERAGGEGNRGMGRGRERNRGEQRATRRNAPWNDRYFCSYCVYSLWSFLAVYHTPRSL